MSETILELGAEGGSITIFGIRGKGGLRRFVIEKNESALYDLLPDEKFKGESVVKSGPVGSWDNAVRLLNKNPNWYRLYPVKVHPDFEERILALVEDQGGVSAVERWCGLLGMEVRRLSNDGEQSVESGLVGALSADKIKALYEKYLDLIRLEIVEFGVRPTEVRHLIGRLGEFYCALTVEGSLSSTANQHGFDVISKAGRKISVKTTAQQSGFVKISDSTLAKVDDLMLIKYQDQSLTVIFYGDVMTAVGVARHYPELGWYELDISRARNVHGR